MHFIFSYFKFILIILNFISNTFCCSCNIFSKIISYKIQLLVSRIQFIMK